MARRAIYVFYSTPVVLNMDNNVTYFTWRGPTGSEHYFDSAEKAWVYSSLNETVSIRCTYLNRDTQEVCHRWYYNPRHYPGVQPRRTLIELVADFNLQQGKHTV